MAVKPTKELFDEYFAEKPENVVAKTRSTIDRKEVYDYEKKIGKQLIDMNVDELFDMLSTFRSIRKKNEQCAVSFSSLSQIFSSYRALWNFYIEHYEVIKNPWYDKRMRGTNAALRISEHKEAFTKEKLDSIIKYIHDSYMIMEKADYVECIILLFYEGFARAEEIVALKESDINFKTREINLPNKKIKLSKRCFQLLKQIHEMEDYIGWHGVNKMVSWHDGYFKYSIRPSNEIDFQDRTEMEITTYVNRRLTDVGKELKIGFNYNLIYFLGFYDRLCEYFGAEQTNDIIYSVRDSENAAKLISFAKEYGVAETNVTVLKNKLRVYVH